MSKLVLGNSKPSLPMLNQRSKTNMLKYQPSKIHDIATGAGSFSSSNSHEDLHADETITNQEMAQKVQQMNTLNKNDSIIDLGPSQLDAANIVIALPNPPKVSISTIEQPT